MLAGQLGSTSSSCWGDYRLNPQSLQQGLQKVAVVVGILFIAASVAGAALAIAMTAPVSLGLTSFFVTIHLTTPVLMGLASVGLFVTGAVFLGSGCWRSISRAIPIELPASTLSQQSVTLSNQPNTSPVDSIPSIATIAPSLPSIAEPQEFLDKSKREQEKEARKRLRSQLFELHTDEINPREEEAKERAETIGFAAQFKAQLPPSTAISAVPNEALFPHYRDLPSHLREHLILKMVTPKETVQTISRVAKEEYVQTDKVRQLQNALHRTREKALSRGFTREEIDSVGEMIAPDGISLLAKRLEEWLEARACIQLCAALIHGHVNVGREYLHQLMHEEFPVLTVEKLSALASGSFPEEGDLAVPSSGITGEQLIHLAERVRKEFFSRPECAQWEKLWFHFRSDNTAIRISKEIQLFQALTSLEVTAPKVSELPLLAFPKLQTLRLDHLSTRDLPHMELPELTKCVVTNQTMPNFHKDSQFPKLKTLEVYGASESSYFLWPEETRLPKEVEILSILSSVKIVPSSIEQLSKLKSLRIGNYTKRNALEKISWRIVNCQALEEVTIWDFCLTDPEVLAPLGLIPNLNTLSLSVDFTLLPESFGCAEKLKELYISENLAIFPLTASLPLLTRIS